MDQVAFFTILGYILGRERAFLTARTRLEILIRTSSFSILGDFPAFLIVGRVCYFRRWQNCHKTGWRRELQHTDRSEASLAFQEKWSSLRKQEELIPQRTAFDPVEFVEFLNNLAIVEMNPEARTVQILLAGNAIRDLVGLELTGKNFHDFVRKENIDPSWPHRIAYHDHPCGRHEVQDVYYRDGFHIECALTMLPLQGASGERFVVLLVESGGVSYTSRRDKTEIIATPVKAACHIDIGAGVPAFSSLPGA